MATVGIFECSQYDPHQIKDILAEGLLHFGGIEAFVQTHDKVLLKPNLLTAAAPEEVVCTHPAVLEGVILLLKEICAEVWVGDSPGFGSIEKVAGASGLSDVCKRTGAELVSFNNPIQVSCPKGRTAKEFTLSEWVVKADKIVNLPKLKLHNLMAFTGAVKNMMGCIPGIGKGKMHVKYPRKRSFSQMLLDVYNCTKPTINIMDGIIAMEQQGPRNGRPKQVGYLLVSTDGLALDAIACRIIGLEPMSVPVIRLGHIQKLREGKANRIKTVGVPLSSARVTDFDLGQSRKVGFLENFLRGDTKRLPEIDQEKCTLCAICAEACPCHKIYIEDGKARIDFSGCIACLCCQELCPSTAINLKK